MHVLNNCKAAGNLRQYNQQHDGALQEIIWLTGDLSDGYKFPKHIVPTDLPPDIVWWDDQQKSLMLAALTINYEKNFEVAAEPERREEKYEELLTGACNAGYKTELITLEVGSRGVISPASF